MKPALPPRSATCSFLHYHAAAQPRDTPVLCRRQAVFPLYIVHQTLINVFAHYLQVTRMGPVIEGAVLVVLTITASFGVEPPCTNLQQTRLAAS
jgi:glucan biosynthesis protein C